MGNLFAKKRTREPPIGVSQQDQAILQLKSLRDRIKQCVKRNEKQMEREREVARRLLKNGNKERALLMLKKKRYQETMIERTLQQLDKIDMMVHDLEFAEVQKRVVDGLKTGKEALEQINKMFSIDDIEKLMDETTEAAEYQKEISALLVGKLDDVDEDEVEQELEALLAAEVIPQKFPDIPSDPLNEKQAGKEHVKRQRVALEAQ